MQRLEQNAPVVAAAVRAALPEKAYFANQIMNYGTAPPGAKKYLASTLASN